MNRQRLSTRGFRLRVLLTMALMIALLGITGGAAPASAAPTPGVPDWCQWIPPEWWPPECQGGGGGGDTGGPVEERFSATGPWAVTSESVSVPGVTTNPVVLTYPTDIGADNTDHPILVFAVGTGGIVQENDPFFNHFASWGYVVAGISSPGFLAPDQPANMRAAAEHLVAENGNASSTFFDNLDIDNIGAFGHSQGAGATLQLMGSSVNADGLFSSAVPLALPDRIWWFSGESPNYSMITQPIFFVSGTNDFLTSPAEQTFFLDQVAGPAAKAAVVGADHGGMIEPSLGYVTAWFKYTLGGDAFARGAFVETDGSPPEVSTNSAWTNWASKNLA